MPLVRQGFTYPPTQVVRARDDVPIRVEFLLRLIQHIIQGPYKLVYAYLHVNTREWRKNDVSRLNGALGVGGDALNRTKKGSVLRKY